MDFLIFCLLMNFSLIAPFVALFYWLEVDYTGVEAATMGLLWPVFAARGMYRSFIKMWRNQ